MNKGIIVLKKRTMLEHLVICRLRPAAENKTKPERNYILNITIFMIFICSFTTNNINAQSTSAQQHREELQQQREQRCIACIRQVSSIGVSGDLTKQKCEGYYCGPFQISYQYWAEAGKPRADSSATIGGREFEKCARDNQCAEQTVRAYFKKYKRDCNNDGRIDCLDMAALHKGGPTSCASDWFYKSRFWLAFNKTACAGSIMESDEADSASNYKKSEMEKRNEESNRVVMKNQTLTSECLDCICEALSGCGNGGQTSSAQNCGSGTVCGPFAISQTYWKDGRRPGASWTACTRTRECSIVTVRNYMEKNRRDCNGDGFITCEDYAAIHRRGPRACTNRDVLRETYWQKFLACRANQRPTKDVNMVKVDTNSTTSELINRDEAINSNYSTDEQSATRPSERVSSSTNITPSLLDSQPQQQSSTSVEVDHARERPQTSQIQAVMVAQSSINETNGAQREGSHEEQQQQQQRRTTATLSATTMHYQQQPIRTRLRGPSSSTVTTISTTTTSNNISHDENENGLWNPAPGASFQRPFSPPSRPHEQQQQHHQRPTIDYNQLPTIIISKPLGSSSTQRFSPTPSSPIPSQLTTDNGATTMTSFSEAEYSFPSVQSSSVSSVTNHQSSPTSVTTSSLSASSTMSTNNGTGGPESNSVIDYSIPEPFPFASAAGGVIGEEIIYDAVDRTNFDKVVNGIVANPDFSKSYPPTSNSPEINGFASVRRKSSQQQQQHSYLGTSREQDLLPVQRSRLGAHGVAQAQQSSSSTIQHHSTLSSTIQDDNKSESQSVSSRAPTATSGVWGSNMNKNDSQQIQTDRGDAASPIVGSNAVSMSNLFEVGLNESNKIASECLDCICDASSNCDTTVQCISKQREKNRCGLYMISWNQYKESDISLTTLLAPTTSNQQGIGTNDGGGDYDEKLYYECSTDKNCAEKLIHLYIEKHLKDCNNDGKIDCFDIAAIHRVGPDLCNTGKFLSSQYWKDFNICYATERQTASVASSTTDSSSTSTTSALATTERYQSRMALIVS